MTSSITICWWHISAANLLLWSFASTLHPSRFNSLLLSSANWRNKLLDVISDQVLRMLFFHLPENCKSKSKLVDDVLLKTYYADVSSLTEGMLEVCGLQKYCIQGWRQQSYDSATCVGFELAFGSGNEWNLPQLAHKSYRSVSLSYDFGGDWTVWNCFCSN